MRRLLLVSMMMSALCVSHTSYAAGDAKRGELKTEMCKGCHGIPGWRTAYPEIYSVPKLGGQHPAYIVKALQAYKAGDRQHPSMLGIAQSLSDQDMEDLAAYYGLAVSK